MRFDQGTTKSFHPNATYVETALNVSKVSKTHKNTRLSSYHSLKIVENSSECIVEHVDLIDTIQNHH